MKSRTLRVALALLAAAVLGVTADSLSAATMSASTTPPVVDGADIANYGTATGTVKWWTDTHAPGQSFTVGSDPLFLDSITYQVTETQKAEPTKKYRIRVGSISGDTFTEFYAEEATQDFTWNGGEYMTWSFDSPVFLSPNGVYGVEIDMLSSTSGWRTGIPYLNRTNNEYADGAYFHSPGFGSQIWVDNRFDLIFHLGLSTGPSALYWDLNDAAAGAGGPAPNGTWDAAGTNWNRVAEGTDPTVAWTPGSTAVFSAGSDATGDYTITVSGTQDIGGLKFEDGNVTLSGGTLRMTDATMVKVPSGQTATIASVISEAGAPQNLIKVG